MSKTSPQNTPAGSEKENELRDLAHQFDDAAIYQALLDELNLRIAQFTRGIEAYKKHPRTHRPPEPHVLKQIGAARLLDYGINEEGQSRHPVLLIPSLINRAYILDLTEDRSLVRHMATQGLRPLLVDWGHPSEAEQNFNLESYITGPLQVFFDIACQLSDTKPSVLGYCMGGLLALAIANNNPNKSASLSLLATPWDFHSGIGAHLLYLTTLRPSLELILSTIGNLPVDILQVLFASLDPSLTSTKFRNFSGMEPSSPRAQHFVTLEDWLNDGVPLVANVAKECLFDWYLENNPAKGEWIVAGQSIDPHSITCPSLTIIPEHDHIVPPVSAKALAKLLPENKMHLIKAGHISMMTGSHAKVELYEPLAKWIKLQTMYIEQSSDTA